MGCCKSVTKDLVVEKRYYHRHDSTFVLVDVVGFQSDTGDRNDESVIVDFIIPSAAIAYVSDKQLSSWSRSDATYCPR